MAISVGIRKVVALYDIAWESGSTDLSGLVCTFVSCSKPVYVMGNFPESRQVYQGMDLGCEILTSTDTSL